MSETASSYQVGGNHYARHKIQKWAIVEEYDLNPWGADVLGYLLREKPGIPRIEDLRKARHNLDYLIEREERKAAAELRQRQIEIAKRALAEAREHINAVSAHHPHAKRYEDEAHYWGNMARAAEMEGLV